MCPGDGPAEGRHGKTRRKERKKRKQKEKKSSDTELEKPNQHFYVQLVGQGRHKRPEGRQRWRGKIIDNDNKETSLRTKQTRTQGDAADEEMQSTGIPSTSQGTGQHSKLQRLGLRTYGCHLSPPDNAPWGCIFAGGMFAVRLARVPLTWQGTGQHSK